MKIYTKKGDTGETSLFGGGPYPKDDKRIEAYGTVDELNSVIGCALSEIESGELAEILRSLQEQLFVVGAELATLKPTVEMAKGFIQSSHVQKLESQIDAWEKELAPLKKFILPGGCKSAAWLHLARTICRRAERKVVTLSHETTLRPELLIYLNRLSDWLFVLARVVNARAKMTDILWEGIFR